MDRNKHCCCYDNYVTTKDMVFKNFSKQIIICYWISLRLAKVPWYEIWDIWLSDFLLPLSLMF